MMIGWNALLDLLAVINRIRFSAILVFAGGFALYDNDQGQEIVLLIGDGGIGIKFVFAAVVSGWALSAWYCARTLCDRPFDRPESRALIWFTNHLPRTLGALAFGSIALAFYRQSEIGIAITSVVLMAVFYIFALVRRKGPFRILFGLPNAANRKREPARNLFHLPRTTLKVFIALLTTAFVAMVLATAFPLSLGVFLGPGVIAIGAFALIIPIGTLLVLMGTESRFPVITALFALAVLFSAFNDNHTLRNIETVSIKKTQDTDIPGYTKAGQKLTVIRPTLRKLYDDWHFSQCRTERDCIPPLILVATAGGGSRAAYWTTTVLGELSDVSRKISSPSDNSGRFEDRLFSISGVSGGALGSVIYRALLANQQQKKSAPSAINCTTASSSYRACGQSVAGGEFLGPILATALYPDLLQRFLPIPVFDDRASTLERSWEQQWDKVFPNSPVQLSQGMMSLWSKRVEDGLSAAYRFWPALYLNGTHVESSRRIITTNVGIDRSFIQSLDGKKSLVHADSFDFYAIHPLDIPMSTAANNSARFPFVAPAGRIKSGVDGLDWGHIVDGGYFENFGAETALETLHALTSYAQESERRFIPILIQITSDPEFDGQFTGRDHDGLIQNAQVSSPLLNEALSPPKAFMGLRGAQGRRAFNDLAQGVENATKQLALDPKRLDELVAAGKRAAGDTSKILGATVSEMPVVNNHLFAHFRMCPAEKGVPTRTPALGWSLSNDAKKTIDGYLPATSIQKLVNAAKNGKTQFCSIKIVKNSCADMNIRALQRVVCRLAILTRLGESQ